MIFVNDFIQEQEMVAGFYRLQDFLALLMVFFQNKTALGHSLIVVLQQVVDSLS